MHCEHHRSPVCYRHHRKNCHPCTVVLLRLFCQGQQYTAEMYRCVQAPSNIASLHCVVPALRYAWNLSGACRACNAKCANSLSKSTTAVLAALTHKPDVMHQLLLQHTSSVQLLVIGRLRLLDYDVNAHLWVRPCNCYAGSTPMLLQHVASMQHLQL
jgi:hypothetical protein